jgi:thioredoxin reductase (NADPH)
MEEKIYDTVIIGSGPAGLTAAIYNIRAALKTVVVAGNIPGGQLTITTLVENWPGFPTGIGGLKLMMDMREQVKNLGVEVRDGLVDKVSKEDSVFKVELQDKTVLRGRAVIVAVGAGARWLELPKEKELIGKGISGCATCDGNFFRDKTVAVVGGGNTACEDAEFLAKICQKVYLIHRRDTLRATAIEAERVLKDERIEKIWDSEVIGINDQLRITNYELEKLQNIKIKNVKTGEEKILEIDGLFVAVGRIPATDFLKGLINLREDGYVILAGDTEYTTMTSVPGIFAAGDCMDDKYRQAVVAAGSGAKAAIDAERWLKT